MWGCLFRVLLRFYEQKIDILRKFSFSDRGSKPDDLLCFCFSPSVKLLMRHKYDFFKMLNVCLCGVSFKRVSTQTCCKETA